MKNKKGFTLIELLAVIVILAIIALIATPIVLNMINNARKSAAKSSALGYIEAIEYNNGFAESEQAGYTKINGENLDVTSSTFDNLKLKGKRPTSGTVSIVNGKVTSANLCVEGYSVAYNGKDATVGSKNCNESNSSTQEQTPTEYTVYSLNQEIKYDPVNNQKCTSGTTCYTWYVITNNDTKNKSKITLQMDHDLIKTSGYTNDSVNSPALLLSTLATQTASWSNSLLLNYTYDTTGINNNYGVLTCTNGSCEIRKEDASPVFTTSVSNVKARIITGEEVATISGLNWTPTNYSISSYGSSATLAPDSSNQGYWTLTTVDDRQNNAWIVHSSGNFLYDNMGYYDKYGIRPVIDAPKEALQ